MRVFGEYSPKTQNPSKPFRTKAPPMQRLGGRPVARSALKAQRRPCQRPLQRPFGLVSWITDYRANSAARRGEMAAASAAPKGGAGLPPPEEAQQLDVVRLPNFLSEAEIASILQAAADIRRDGAGAVRLQSSPSLPGADGALPSWDQGGYETDRGEWSTTYLHTELMFQNRLPELHKKVKEAAVAADRANWGVCAAALAASAESVAGLEGGVAGELNTRVVELHMVGPTGGLPAARHYDSGSCVTIDLMLVEPASGGGFETLEINSAGEEVMRQHEFKRGDAIVFPSHKYHCVQPVEEGMRQVMILEVWVGEERRCNHRCEQHFGRCPHVRMPWSNTTSSTVAW